MNQRLEALQELLYAEGKHKVLIVLQAMDTDGKDGVIRQVFDRIRYSVIGNSTLKKRLHHGDAFREGIG